MYEKNSNHQKNNHLIEFLASDLYYTGDHCQKQTFEKILKNSALSVERFR